MAGGEAPLHQAGAERRGAPTGNRLIIRGSGRSARLVGAAAILAWLSTLALFWPGIALSDSVDQYGQVLSGAYEDWHPPVMARLWSLFAGWWPGGAPMFLIQTSLYWLGLGLIATACARFGKYRAGLAVLAIGAFFVTSCWLGAVLKDAQMVGAMLAATGLVARYRLAETSMPPSAALLTSALLLYALLVRANAPFAVVPLAMLLFRVGEGRSLGIRAAIGVAAMLAVLALTPAINHHLLGAEESSAERSLLIYDLAGIAQRANGEIAGVPSEKWRRPGCYSRLEWDKAGMEGCPGNAALTRPGAILAREWLSAIFHHPLAYALHRLGHFDTTTRLFVAADLAHAGSPVEPEPNALGLGARPGRAALLLHSGAFRLAWLPLAWPVFWIALAPIAVWSAAAAERSPARDLGLALALSAAAMGASFLLVSVASDLRYHLWTMIAAALALPLLASAGAIRRRQLSALLLVAALVSLIGLAGRLLLPPFA